MAEMTELEKQFFADADLSWEEMASLGAYQRQAITPETFGLTEADFGAEG